MLRRPLPHRVDCQHSAISKMASRVRPVARLRTLLQTPGIKLMPCCHDALSARLVEQAGFPLTFVSGFAASAARGLPDTGLMSYAEMLEAMRGVGGALREIPCMGDGDTGYGNAVNTKRTVQGSVNKTRTPTLTQP